MYAVLCKLARAAGELMVLGLMQALCICGVCPAALKKWFLVVAIWFIDISFGIVRGGKGSPIELVRCGSSFARRHVFPSHYYLCLESLLFEFVRMI